MQATPSISVVLPVHNGMPYLPESINSLLSQSFADCEILIIDDGSTDETPQFCAAQQDPRIRYVRQEKRGLVPALNHGLELARAEMIARLDADDIALPERLGLQREYLLRNKGCVLLGSSMYVINTKGETVGEMPYTPQDPVLRWKLMFANPIAHPASMFRKADVMECGAYRAEFDRAEDYDLWTRLCRKGLIANLSQPLVKYRVHSASVSKQYAERQKEVTRQIGANYISDLGLGIDAMTARALLSLYFNESVPANIHVQSVVDACERLGSYFKQCDQRQLAPYLADMRYVIRRRCFNMARLHGADSSSAVAWLRGGLTLTEDPKAKTIGSN